MLSRPASALLDDEPGNGRLRPAFYNLALPYHDARPLQTSALPCSPPPTHVGHTPTLMLHHPAMPAPHRPPPPTLPPPTAMPATHRPSPPLHPLLPCLHLTAPLPPPSTPYSHAPTSLLHTSLTQGYACRSVPATAPRLLQPPHVLDPEIRMQVPVCCSPPPATASSCP